MSTLKDIQIKKILRCPICKGDMEISQDGKSLHCKGTKRHSYDFASGGYVNLTSPGQTGGGDSKGAVRARSEFLDTEHYRPIADKLCELTKKHCPQGGIIIDAGCGEGYYSIALAECGFSVAGFDLSKFATDAAAKRAKRKLLDNSFFGTASVYALPMADSSAHCVVNIFAPCVEKEYKRALKDGGALIVVYAGPRHLWGLKGVIYDSIHTNEERADLPKEMMSVEREELSYSITLKGNQSIKALFAMTPYYWKTSTEDVKKLDGIEELTTEIDIIFAVYKA